MSAPDAEFRRLASLPSDQDGPVFEEPWQAQAFAMAVQLHAQGAFTWPEWAEALANELAAAEARGEGDGALYYRHWLTALEGLVARRGLLEPEAMAQRKAAWAEAYRNTPHGQPVELS